MIGIAKIDDLVFMADKGVLSFMHKLSKEGVGKLHKMGETGMWSFSWRLFKGQFYIFKE